MAVVVNTTLKADTKEAVKQVKILKKEVEKVGKAAEKSGEDISAAMQIGNEATRGLDRSTGGLASKLFKVAKAAKLSGKAMKTALISSGIGAAVVAIGLLVEYWDEIKGLVDGVSSEQATLLKTTENTLAAQEQQLDTISQSENILKLQGKTEKEILAMKRQVTDESIATTKILLEQQKQTKKSQIEAAERNQNITKGIIAFLTAPIVILLGLVDGLTNSLASLGILDEGTRLTEGFLELSSSLLFDPEEVEKEGDKTIKATEEALLKLENTRAGYLVKDKEAAKTAANNKKNDEIEAEKEKAAALERIRKGLIDTEAEERAEKLRLIKEDYDQQIALAAEFYGTNSIKILELKAAQKLAEDEQQAEFDEQDKARKDKIAADEKAAEDERLDKIQENADKEAKIAEALNEQKSDLLNANLDNIAGGFALLGQLAGKNKSLQAAAIIGESAVGIAKSVIDTTASNVAITAQGAALAIPSGGTSVTAAAALVSANNIMSGIGIATNIASTAKALSALKAGGAPPSPTSTSAGGGGGTQPPAFNIVGASGETQLADAIGSQTQRPARAYVVSNDVTTAQEMDRNIIEGASIG